MCVFHPVKTMRSVVPAINGFYHIRYYSCVQLSLNRQHICLLISINTSKIQSANELSTCLCCSVFHNKFPLTRVSGDFHLSFPNFPKASRADPFSLLAGMRETCQKFIVPFDNVYLICLD